MNRVTFRTSKDVRLVFLNPEDQEILVHWINDPAINYFLGRRLPVTREAEKEWINTIPKRMETDPVFGIETIDGELIGTIGLHHINLIDGTTTSGTMIGKKELWGKGYGTKAKMLLLDYVFNALGLRLCYSQVLACNPRSLRYAEKCGYELIATMPKARYRDGIYVDEHILQVTREKFLPLWIKWEESNL